MKKIKVCIISEEAYPHLMGEGSGGSELQMKLLANELVKRGHEVHFVVFGKVDERFKKVNGVNLHIPYYNKKKGWTHFLPSNLFKYMSLLNRVNADVYIQRAGPLTSWLVKLFNKIFIFSVSDDASVSSYLKINSLMDLRFIFHILNVKLSNCVACQTEQQKKFLMENASKNGVVIRNIYIPSLFRSSKNIKHILWVARVTRSKSPEIYLELAESLPDYNFKMIGAVSYGDEDYHDEIRGKAEKIDNLSFIGEVAHEEIYKYYSEASLFVNTSCNEGFPNRFLESWANCTPIVSINFDPDNIISSYELGLSSKNFNQLIEDTRQLMENDDLRLKMGFNAFNYVKKEHDIYKIVDKYEKLFFDLIAKDG